jgi:hypothetical protein
MEEKILAIHTSDPRTENLDLLYYDLDVDFLDDRASKCKIRRAIMDHKKIMLLGVGTEFGLMAPLMRKSSQGSRLFIGPEMGQVLKGKEILGMFEGSYEYAKKHKLTGLFIKGDLIFDLQRAHQSYPSYGYSSEILDFHKYEWCLDLSGATKNLPWYVVNQYMKKRGEDMDDLEKENYESVIYMINGEEANGQ